MKNKENIVIVAAVLIYLVLGCSGKASNTAATAPASDAKPIAVDAKVLTKEYDTNDLAADGKFKGKLLAVSGKIESIAETMGNVTVHVEGHNVVLDVICSFEADQRDAVSKLKKGQATTLIGTGDGLTAGLYVGLNKCKVQ